MENTKDKLNKLGYTLAADMAKADSQAESSKRKLILSLAEKHTGKDEVDAILFGYGKYYTDQGATDSTAQARKSELKAVFQAIAASEVSGDNLKKLQAFSGTFHMFITYARELRDTNKPQKESTSSSTRERVKVNLTEKQQAKVHELVAYASPSQGAEIAVDAAKNIITTIDKSQPETAQLAGRQVLTVIAKMANMLVKDEKFEQFFHNVGGQILEVVDKAQSHLDEVEQQAKQVQQMATQTAA